MNEIRVQNRVSFLLSEFLRHHLLERAEYWLGATDLEKERKWRWDDCKYYIGTRAGFGGGNGIKENLRK